VFVSELSPHTKSLLRSGRVSVLFIEEESATRNLFARRRLSYRCSATEVASSDERFDRVLASLEQRFGRLIQTLRALPDFHLICLSPEDGRYVTGFAKAFHIEDPRRARLRPLRG
jgi:putative heme iron utilization protein